MFIELSVVKQFSDNYKITVRRETVKNFRKNLSNVTTSNSIVKFDDGEELYVDETYEELKHLIV